MQARSARARAQLSAGTDDDADAHDDGICTSTTVDTLYDTRALTPHPAAGRRGSVRSEIAGDALGNLLILHILHSRLLYIYY